jgi:hypothetical protein
MPSGAKPLAIDLFCGLFEPQFFCGAYAAIKKLVAGRAKNPDHVPLCIGGQAPSAVSLELRLMRYFENAVFAASLTSVWHLRPSSFEPIERRIFEVALCLVLGSPFWIFPPRPFLSQVTGGRNRASHGTISTVAIRWLYIEMSSAAKAVATILCGAFMLFSANASGALRAIIRAPFFIGSNGPKRCAALSAKEIIHTVGLS